MKALLITAVICSTTVFAQNVHYYPYDDTDPVTSKMAYMPEKAELRAAQQRIVPAFLCGAYREQCDDTAGFTLHIFPDKTFMIEEWIDIGPSKTVAEGLWSIGENGDVLLDWRQKDFKNGTSEKFYRAQYGECKKMKLFLLFSAKSVHSVLLVSDEMIVSQIEHVYLRHNEYIDWVKVRNELKKKKG